MAETYSFIVGNPNLDRHSICAGRLQGIVDSPLVSKSLRIGTAGTQNAIAIPADTLVTRVGLWLVGTSCTGATLSVGVVGSIYKFISKVSSMTKNDIVMSGQAGSGAGTIATGAYFSSSGNIQLAVGAGGTDDSSVRVLVWYVRSATMSRFGTV